MIRPILFTALLTGIFCAIFAIGIDFVTDMLNAQTVAMVSFTSGFFGSLFAQTVLGRWKER